MEPSSRGRFGAPSLSMSRSSLFITIRRWTWYGEVGDIDEREFGEAVSLSAGSAFIFIADMPWLALGTVRRLPSKLATGKFLREQYSVNILCVFVSPDNKSYRINSVLVFCSKHSGKTIFKGVIIGRNCAFQKWFTFGRDLGSVHKNTTWSNSL